VKTYQARTGTGPAVIATLRNTAIGYHRTNGDTNIARATRRENRRPHDLITTVTSSYPTTPPRADRAVGWHEGPGPPPRVRCC
jgi:hypothetical protein